MFVDHHSDIVIFLKLRVEKHSSLTYQKMYTGATTLRTPGQGSEFYSLREYVAGDRSRILIGKRMQGLES